LSSCGVLKPGALVVDLFASVDKAHAILPLSPNNLYFGQTRIRRPIDPKQTFASLGIAPNHELQGGFLFDLGSPLFDPLNETAIQIIDSVEDLCHWIGALNGGAACNHGSKGLCTFVKRLIPTTELNKERVINCHNDPTVDLVAQFSCMSTDRFRLIREGIVVTKYRTTLADESSTPVDPKDAQVVTDTVHSFGDYPDSFAKLIGHELTHVAQQSCSTNNKRSATVFPSWPPTSGRVIVRGWNPTKKESRVGNSEVVFGAEASTFATDRFAPYSGFGLFGSDPNVITCEMLLSPSFVEAGGLLQFFDGYIETQLDEYCAENLINWLYSVRCPMWSQPSIGVCLGDFMKLFGFGDKDRSTDHDCRSSNFKMTTNYPSGIVLFYMALKETNPLFNGDPKVGTSALYESSNKRTRPRSNSNVCGDTPHLFITPETLKTVKKTCFQKTDPRV
jgi:hypothetical protein